MKIRIEIDDSLEDEIVIRCHEINNCILQMQRAAMEEAEHGRHMALCQGDTEYYLPLEDILFFETGQKAVYAHTREQILETGYKLYELEELLPGSFLRISKSAIVNLTQIYSITRNLAASSLIEFRNSHKRVYVSRNYYKLLAERLKEMRKKV